MINVFTEPLLLYRTRTDPRMRARTQGGGGSGAQISFTPRHGNKVYDTKPKIKIKGVGFGQLATEDLQHLEFDPPMAVNGEKHFEATATVQEDETILLELAPGKR